MICCLSQFRGIKIYLLSGSCKYAMWWNHGVGWARFSLTHSDWSESLVLSTLRILIQRMRSKIKNSRKGSKDVVFYWVSVMPGKRETPFFPCSGDWSDWFQQTWSWQHHPLSSSAPLLALLDKVLLQHNPIAPKPDKYLHLLCPVKLKQKLEKGYTGEVSQFSKASMRYDRVS